jgi:hypothetical protein
MIKDSKLHTLKAYATVCGLTRMMQLEPADFLALLERLSRAEAVCNAVAEHGTGEHVWGALQDWRKECGG